MFWAGKISRPVCVSIYSRRVHVIFENSRQNPKITKISKLSLLIHEQVSKKSLRISVL